MSAADGDASGERALQLGQRLREVRRASEQLCAGLPVEDYVVQSMPDASPLKWHLAHTTWFFETLVLAPYAPRHRAYRAEWDYLFNSYYEALGPRQPRPARGLLSRPTVAEVYAYRAAIDEQLEALLTTPLDAACLDLLELGLHHEQQHQELMLTDLLHAFAQNALRPVYRAAPPDVTASGRAGSGARFIEHAGGVREVGFAGAGFAFDNERPAHRVYLEPFAIAERLVTAGEYVEFIFDGGYARPELWLSEGWAAVQEGALVAPLYWERRDGGFARFSLYGMLPVDLRAPVCHVSFYEADAYARWAKARLPTEQEWEVVAREQPVAGQFADQGVFVPLPEAEGSGLCGAVWNWTGSAYAPYPGFRPASGAVAEYNGKFMVNQLVLRGGSCLSPEGHLRVSYRNFFPASARWQMTGIRLAR